MQVKRTFCSNLTPCNSPPKSSFYCNLQNFLHLLNTHLEPQNLQICTAPPNTPPFSPTGKTSKRSKRFPSTVEQLQHFDSKACFVMCGLGFRWFDLPLADCWKLQPTLGGQHELGCRELSMGGLCTRGLDLMTHGTEMGAVPQLYRCKL